MQSASAKLDTDEARAAREALVGELVVEGDAGTPGVIAALRDVPRHLFVPHVPLRTAYANRAVPIGFGQTISQPAVVAIMTEALELCGRERVLEIGTGTGYQAAVLSRLAEEIYSVERLDALANEAAQRLWKLGYHNVHVRVGDGYLGWPELAPFDRVVLTAAPPELPRTLVQELVDGGVMVAPIGDADALGQSLVRIRRHGDVLDVEELGDVAFVEMVHGA
jgi:protein-L-isoaspartate(D-aspartate) O-methyltransferase